MGAAGRRRVRCQPIWSRWRLVASAMLSVPSRKPYPVGAIAGRGGPAGWPCRLGRARLCAALIIRILALLTRSRGAKRGANDHRHPAMPGHVQPRSWLVDAALGHAQPCPATVPACLLSSRPQVRVLLGPPGQRINFEFVCCMREPCGEPNARRCRLGSGTSDATKEGEIQARPAPGSRRDRAVPGRPVIPGHRWLVGESPGTGGWPGAARWNATRAAGMRSCSRASSASARTSATVGRFRSTARGHSRA